MKVFISVLLLVFLLAPVSGSAQEFQDDSKWMFSPEHEDWIRCESDDQCRMIESSPSQGRLIPNIDFAVNNNYWEQASQYVDNIPYDLNDPKTKKNTKFHPGNTRTKCINSICTMTGNWTQPPPQPKDFQQDAKWLLPPGHDEWLKCESDSQCTLIDAKDCGLKLAVNTKYSKQAGDASGIPNCLSPMRYPKNTAAKCVNNQCVLAGRSEPQ